MEIRECTNREGWVKQEGSEFLQSWQWGQFQERVGKKVFRLQAVEGGEVVWQGQGMVSTLVLGLKYIYFPRVNFAFLSTNDQLSMVNDQLVKFLRQKKYIFAKIEATNTHSSVLCPLSYVRGPQPQTTLVLDLEKNEDEILSQMHAKTRYNIHLAEKKGVVVKLEKNIEVFWQLVQETSTRDEIKSHSKKYYEEMLKSDFCYQLTAYIGDKPIASNIMIIFGDVCTYLHGASASEQRNLMAPYLLQWEGMKFGKKLNCKQYDFWGIAPQIEAGDGKTTCFHNFCWEVNHKWTGITRFKVGFGGSVRNYPQAVDVILRPVYYRLYKFAKRIL